MDSKFRKIPGHTYFDPTKQPKSGYAVPKVEYCYAWNDAGDIYSKTPTKYSKVEQERHRNNFLKKYNECSKDDSC